MQEPDIFTGELPPRKNNKPIDIEILKSLWFRTIKDTIKELSSIPPDKKTRVIFKLEENGYYDTYNVDIPGYSIDLKVQSQIGIKVGNEFLNYLWECGRPKVRISNSDRSSWNYWVSMKFIFRPISDLLDDSSICQFVDNQEIKPWSISDAQIGEYISNASNALANNKVIVRAYCPIYGVKLNDLKSAKLSEHTTLRAYAPRDISFFISKYLSPLSVDKGEFIDQDSMVKIQFELDLKEGENIEKEFELINNELDLIKLGIFLWRNQELPIEDRKWTIPIEEGTCILDNIGRDLNIPIHSRGRIFAIHGSLELNEKGLASLTSIIKTLYEQQKKGQDIMQAIWLFGRSCLAPLYRDVLLDSAIGLESLLVPGPSDSTYRFKLHGKIILGNNDERVDDFKILGDIYRGRSKAVHGEDNIVKVRELAFSSREYLATAILNVSLLCQKGLLSPKEIAEGLQDLIMGKSVLISKAIFDC